MNSKSEFNRCHVPRLVMENKEDEEDDSRPAEMPHSCPKPGFGRAPSSRKEARWHKMTSTTTSILPREAEEEGRGSSSLLNWRRTGAGGLARFTATANKAGHLPS